MKLRKAFQSYDTEKDGVVSLDEFKAVFSNYNYTDEEMNTIFNDVVSGLLLTWQIFNAYCIFISHPQITITFGRMSMAAMK